MKRLAIFLAMLGSGFGLGVAPCYSQTTPVVWVSDSLVRVGQTDAPTASKSISLYGARGEYLDSQIVVTAPAGGLTNVNVTASNLTGPGGAVIASSNFSFYRELYVDVTTSSPSDGGSDQQLPTGWYTDPLIPFVDPATGMPPIAGATYPGAPFLVAAGQNQPIWIDLFIPRGESNSPPGDYTGTINVTSAQGNVSIPVNVTLWNFELPLRPSLLSNFNSGGVTSAAIEEELLRNRVMPDTQPSSSTESSYITNYGFSGVDLGFDTGASFGHCQMSAAPSVAQFQAAKAANNSSLLIYDFSADEIDQCTSEFPTLIQWAANMHAAGVDNFVTVAPVPALFSDGTGSGRSAVDIWVIQADYFTSDPGNIATVMAKGDQVWAYTTLVQDSFTPKWEIDFLPINFRIIQGWIDPVQGIIGFLYWSVNDWSSNPYTNVYSPDNPGYPGEGQLVYPGGPAGLQGVAPSMRLKWIRDGVQDYEYFQILRNLGQGAFALNVGKTVAPDWTNWTRTPATLESARIQLGQEINSISQVSLKPSVTALSSSLNPEVGGQSVTFTATVSSSAGGTPTGSVTFANGTTTLGTVGLNSSGMATYTTTRLAVGSPSITASYGGDTNFATSTSSSLTETVNVAGFAPVSPPSPVVAGQNLVIPITIYAASGSNLSFTLSCQGLPAKATCLFNQNPVSPGPPPNGTTVQLTFGTLSSGVPPNSSHRRPWPWQTVGIFGVFAALSAAGITALFSQTPRRRLASCACIAVVAVAVILGGCTGTSGSGSGTAYTGTPKGPATFTISATSGAMTISTQVTVTVQ